MIGLVGHSGSGKSTLVNLICRFYDVTEGAVFIDGVDVRSVPVAEFRRAHRPRAAGALPLLRHHRREHRLRQARMPRARRSSPPPAPRMPTNSSCCAWRTATTRWSANAARGFPAASASASPSPAPRSSIPPILILDEATSSVDTETEKEIQKALDNLVRGRTTIAIAHRLSTLRKADRLVVMDRGRLVELGNHDELMAAEGHYQLSTRRRRATSIPEPVNSNGQSRTQRKESPENDPVPGFQPQRDAYGQLVLTSPNGERHAGVVPVRAFPIGAPDDGIALVNGEGREVGWVNRIADLPPEILAGWSRRTGKPRLHAGKSRRFSKFPSFVCPSTWQVATNRGKAAPDPQGEEDIRRLSQTRLLIADTHGIQFLVRDIGTLDQHSRKLLDRFL